MQSALLPVGDEAIRRTSLNAPETRERYMTKITHWIDGAPYEGQPSHTMPVEAAGACYQPHLRSGRAG